MKAHNLKLASLTCWRQSCLLWQRCSPVLRDFEYITSVVPCDLE